MKSNKIILIALAVTLSGCSIFKKREVKLEKSSFSHNLESKSELDSVVKKTDKTIITESEQADTSAVTPEHKINTKTPANFADLVAGLYLIDNSLVSVKATLDTSSNTINTEAVLKPQKVGLKFNRNKRTETNKTEETNKSNKKQNKESTEAKNKNKGSISEPKGLAWLWGIVVGVVAVVLFFVFRKKRPG